MIQFIKYALIGAFATLINMGVAELCARKVWPCLDKERIKAAKRALNAVLSNMTGFIIANVICYLMNRAFVFTPGRHSIFIEFAMFFAGSAFAAIFGSFLLWMLVRLLDMGTRKAFLINIATALALNFAIRKFLVFQG